MSSELSLFNSSSLIAQGYAYVNTASEKPLEDVTWRLFLRLQQKGGIGAWIARTFSTVSSWWIGSCAQKALSAWKFDHVATLSQQSVQPHLASETERNNLKAIIQLGRDQILGLAKENDVSKSKTEFIQSVFKSFNESEGLEACASISNFFVNQLLKAVHFLLSIPFVGKVDTQSKVYDEKDRAIFEFDPSGDLMGEILTQKSDLTLKEKADRWNRKVEKYSSDPKAMLVDAASHAGFHSSRVKQWGAKLLGRIALSKPGQKALTKIGLEALAEMDSRKDSSFASDS